jgi:hypothetical protein
MSHISSTSHSAYPYRGTLSRLDKNGDGMLSNGELEAASKPGMLSNGSGGDTNDGLDSSTSALNSFVAKLLQLPSVGSSSDDAGDLVQASAASETASSADLYQATYGQYAMEGMAA